MAAVQAELLRSAGHEVDQISLPVVGAAWKWPAKGLALPLRLLAYWPAALRLRRGRYDVIHIHWLTHGIVGVMARRPFLAQAHGSDLHRNLRSWIYRRVTQSVLEHARVVFYVTPNLRRYLETYAEKLVLLPNPVEMRGVANPGHAPTGVSRVVVFTRLDPVKGVDQIFPAVERLSGSVEVTAIDWGPLARDYARRYGTAVRFVKRFPHGEIGDFLRQFDLVIGQMRQGILSLMEIEALAAGRPLITAVDWSLYPTDPPPVVWAMGQDAIVRAIETLKTDAVQLERLSQEGPQWAARNHGYAHHLQLLEAAYFGVTKD